MGKATSPLDRLLQRAAGNGVLLGSADDPARKTAPNVWEWLSRVDCGEYLKEPARLTIQLVPGGVQASLSDSSLKVTVDASCASLAEVLAALEEALTRANPTIRSWGRGETVTLKKKPKKKDSPES